MSKLTIPMITFLALVPSMLMAEQAPANNGKGGVSAAEFAYSNFVLSRDDVNEIESSLTASCPKKSADSGDIFSDDSGSISSAEARYQTACFSKQVKRHEKQHKRDHDRARSDLSAQAKSEYSTEYLRWIKTRYTECERDRSENLGGALKHALFAACKLYELKRRAKWRGVTY
jgi:uncharacterized protein YecT (DUF1311 family)